MEYRIFLVVVGCMFLVVAVSATASFTYDPHSGSPPLLVNFTDTSTGSPTGWSWFFGDENYNGSWTTRNASSGFAQRHYMRVATAPDGDLFMTGGVGTLYRYNSTWRSTTDGSTWLQRNSSCAWPTRSAHAMFALPNGSLVIAGGEGDSSYYNDVWMSNDDGVVWKLINSSAGWSGRAGMGYSVLPDGSLVISGGYDGVTRFADVWRSTNNGSTWIRANASAFTNRSFHSQVTTTEGKILVTGGASPSWLSDSVVSSDNGYTWTVASSSSGWGDLSYHSSVAMPDGSVVLTGGFKSPGGVMSTAWRTIDNGSTWSSLSDSISSDGRYEHAMAVTRNGSILIIGGANATDCYNNMTRSLVPASSFLQSPSHTYTSCPGYGDTCSVVLMAFTSASYNTSRYGTSLVTLTSLISPTASFSGVPTSGSPSGTTVTFTDSSYSNVTSWNWTFGDGYNSTDQNPTHTYHGTGSYTVNLTVTNPYGSDTESKTAYITLSSSGAGDWYFQQDLEVEQDYPLAIYVRDSTTGSLIPGASGIDEDYIALNSTGTGVLTGNYTLGSHSFTLSATGYYGTVASVTMLGGSQTETVYLTAEYLTGGGNQSQTDWTESHNVRFIVRTMFGSPVEDVLVTAHYVESSGPIGWLYDWGGVPDNVSIQNTTLSGYTGDDGAIVFMMVKSVKYEVTAYKAGEVDAVMSIYPQDDEYPIWVDGSGQLFEHGYNQLEMIQFSVNAYEANSSYGRINVTYIDYLGQTTSATILINQSSSSGNSTTETTVASYTSTSSGNFTHDFDIADSRGESYTVRLRSAGTTFDSVARDYGVTFKPGPINLGIPEDLLVYAGMVVIIFVALCFTRTLPGPTVIIVMFLAWIFYMMGWWRDLAPEWVVLIALGFFTAVAVVFNVMIRSKKKEFP